VIDTPAALAADPLLVKRLLRLAATATGSAPRAALHRGLRSRLAVFAHPPRVIHSTTMTKRVPAAARKTKPPFDRSAAACWPSRSPSRSTLVAAASSQRPPGPSCAPLLHSTSTVTATTTRPATPTAHPAFVDATLRSHSLNAGATAPHPADRAQNKARPTTTTHADSIEQGGWTSLEGKHSQHIPSPALLPRSDPANQAGGPAVAAAVPRSSGQEGSPELPPGPIVVVLTTDYS